MGRILVIQFLIMLPVFESSDDFHIANKPDMFTSFEISNITDIYYQFCQSKKCDNTTHVPEVKIVIPEVTVCCFPKCSCEAPTFLKRYCPEKLNALDTYPPCINAQMKPWNPSKPIYNAYRMISQCASRSYVGDDIADRCEFGVRFNELDTKIPVAEDTFTMTFANRYCAACNNITDYIPWMPAIDCATDTFRLSPIETAVTRIQQSEDCRLYFIPPDGQKPENLYSCGRYISECNMTGKWRTYDPILEAGCRAMAISFQFRYRNVFCYLCNSDGSLDDMPDCTGQPHQSIAVSFELTYPFTYNVSHDEINGTVCGRYSMYDPFQDTCLEIKCLLHRIYVGDGQCQRMVKRMGGMNFLIFLKFTPQINVLAVPFVMDPLLQHFKEYAESVEEEQPETPLIQIGFGHKTKSATDESSTENKIDYILAYFVLMLPIYSPSGMVHMSNIETLLKYHGGNVSLDGPLDEQIPFWIELDTVDSALEADDIVKYNSFAFEPGEFDDLESYENDTLLPVHDCPLVELNLSIYNIASGRLGVTDEIFSTDIGRNEYMMTNDGASIITCIDIYQSLVTESVTAYKSSTVSVSLTCRFFFILYGFIFFEILSFSSVTA